MRGKDEEGTQDLTKEIREIGEGFFSSLFTIHFLLFFPSLPTKVSNGNDGAV